MRDDQAGAAVAAVSDHGCPADGGLRAGQLPCLAVVAVAWQGPADGDDKPGVGVDDDLVVGGVVLAENLIRAGGMGWSLRD
ncbi:hypothetical protein GCM10018966_066140 [Streptomyces yanii]